jgi:hypothetical protein
MDPMESLIQWATGGLSLGVKRPGHEAKISLPGSAEMKNDGAKPHSSICLQGMLLKELSTVTPGT